MSCTLASYEKYSADDNVMSKMLKLLIVRQLRLLVCHRLSGICHFGWFRRCGLAGNARLLRGWAIGRLDVSFMWFAVARCREAGLVAHNRPSLRW